MSIKYRRERGREGRAMYIRTEEGEEGGRRDRRMRGFHHELTTGGQLQE